MEPKYTYINVFTKARPLPLSPARSIPSRSPHYTLKIRFNIIHPSTYSFLASSDSRFQRTTTYAPLVCPKRDTPSASEIVTCG